MRRLGHAVGFDHRTAEQPLQLGHDPGRQRRRGRADQAQARAARRSPGCAARAPGSPGAWSARPCTRSARTRSSQAKKRRALNPGVQTTAAPAARVASTAATRPWMWNSGMTFRHRSAGRQSEGAAHMVRRDAEVALRQRHDLGSRGGAGGVQHQGHLARPGRHRRGRRGSGTALRPQLELAGRRVRGYRQLEDADPVPRRHRARRRRGAGRHDQRLGLQVREVALELVGPVGGIERRRDGRGRERDEGRRHLGTVRQDEADRVAAADAAAVQRRDGPVDLAAQAAIGQRRPVDRSDRGRLVRAPPDDLLDAVGHAADDPNCEWLRTQPGWTVRDSRAIHAIIGEDRVNLPCCARRRRRKAGARPAARVPARTTRSAPSAIYRLAGRRLRPPRRRALR